MRLLALSVLLLAGCSNMQRAPLTPEQQAANQEQMMRAMQMMQQAQQRQYAPQPAQQLPQQTRCVSTVYGQQVVTNCN